MSSLAHSHEDRNRSHGRGVRALIRPSECSTLRAGPFTDRRSQSEIGNVLERSTLRWEGTWELQTTRRRFSRHDSYEIVDAQDTDCCCAPFPTALFDASSFLVIVDQQRGKRHFCYKVSLLTYRVPKAAKIRQTLLRQTFRAPNRTTDCNQLTRRLPHSLVR